MVSLAKGQTISLKKHTDEGLKTVVMGLGWDVKKKGGLLGSIFGGSGDIDLDASACLFDGKGTMVDTVWFRQLQSQDGALIHTGDNRTGEGDGDDEQIIVNLDGVNPAVTSIVFVVSSFTGETFAQIENAFCRVVNQANGAELARYQLSQAGSHTAQIMAKLTRQGGSWDVTAIGAIANGRTIRDLEPVIKQHA